MASKSPVHKRIRLDSRSPSPSPPIEPERRLERDQKDKASGRSVFDDEERDGNLEANPEDEDHCVICLHHIRDRTVLPCAHDRLCFECIFEWCQQSRKCPLCNAPIGPFLIHNVRSKYDYSKYFLHPLRTSPPPGNLALLSGPDATLRNRGGARGQSIRWGNRRRNGSASRERRERDELELAIEHRRWVYRNKLYAKHVASNPYTRYRPAPTPAQISVSPEIISRATIFVRRELRVWVNLDVEFLTTFILSLMKTLDLRSESAVKLLAEFLDMDTRYYVGDPQEASEGRFTNAEHFAHELYSYLRSPFRDLATYDSAVQYDVPADAPSAPQQVAAGASRWNRSSSSEIVLPLLPRRHGSSHPPRSPRDAYSRSPSPTNSLSHEKRSRPRSLRQEPVCTKSDNNKAPATDNLDAKGKGKVPLRSRTDSWRPHQDHDRVRHAHASGRPRRHLDSSSRSPVQSDNRRSPSVPQEPFRHSPFGESDLVKRDHIERSDSRKRSTDSPPTPSQIATDVKGRGVTRKNIPTDERARLYDNAKQVKTVDHQPEIPDVLWGISIKGQAKLLNQNQELTRAASDSRRESSFVEASSVPKKRPLNPSSLDVLHAHLGHGPTTRRGNTRAPSPGAPTQNVVTEVDSKNITAHEASRDQSCSTTTPLQPALAPRVSAREIMARTRARLAKLREEPSSMVNMIADPPSNQTTTGEDAETSPSVLDLRSRLMRRLEEEKRQAIGGQMSDHGEQHTSDHVNDNSGRSSEAHGKESSNRNSMVQDFSSDSQQAEIKLRAQALLRVRLNTERSKADVPLDQGHALSREEALKARLLSRRT